jgi:hypothetical protein
MNKRLMGWCCFVFCLSLMCFSAQSVLGASHYPCGGEGVNGAVLPPSHLPIPGNTETSALHSQSKLIYYTADQINDNNGDKALDADLDIFAFVQRFIWMKKIDNTSDWGLHLLIPLQSIDLDLSVPGGPTVADDDEIGLGDIVVEGLYAIHKPNYDIALGGGLILPTGSYDSTKPASTGLGYTSIILTAGLNYKFGEKNLWSVSALNRFLINFKQEETRITPGNELLIEWGVGRAIPYTPTFLITPGIFGHAYLQVSEDSGDNATDTEKKSYGIGLECNFFSLKNAIQINVRASTEFNVENDSEGDRFEVKFTKSFF